MTRHMRLDASPPPRVTEHEEGDRRERPNTRALRTVVVEPTRTMRTTAGWGGFTIGFGVGLIVALLSEDYGRVFLWGGAFASLGTGLGLSMAAVYQQWLTAAVMAEREVEERTTWRREGPGNLDGVATHEGRRIPLGPGRGYVWPDGATIGGLHFNAAIMARITERMLTGQGFARVDIPGGGGMDTALYSDGTIPDAFTAAGWIDADRAWTDRAYEIMGVTPPPQ